MTDNKVNAIAMPKARSLLGQSATEAEVNEMTAAYNCGDINRLSEILKVVEARFVVMRMRSSP